MAKASGTIDMKSLKEGHDDASTKATTYITAVNQDGIKVHAANNPNSNYSLINAHGLDINVDNESRAAFLDTGARIGKAYNSSDANNESHIELDYHSLQMIDKDGDTYFYISDLRNNAGVATLIESFVGNGSQQYFNVTLDISSVVSVTINGTSTTAYSLSSITRTEIQFNVAPEDGAEIIVTYTTTNQNAKSFTLGTRGTGDVGACSIAMGAGTVASGGHSMACGHSTTASGKSSYAEGDSTIASGMYSHAEGRTTYATGNLSHAEGEVTTAAGLYSHAENDRTHAHGKASHAQGYDTYAMGNFSTACGNTTRAYGRSTFVIGEYNSYPTPTPAADVRGDHAFIIGNGTSATPDSNALTVGWDGNITVNNHSSPIGARLVKEGSDSMSAVSCSAGGWVTIGTITLTTGTWIINCRARFTPTASGTNYSAVCLGLSTGQGWYDRRYSESTYQIQHSFVQIMQPTETTTYYLRGTCNNAGKFERSNGAQFSIDAVRIV